LSEFGDSTRFGLEVKTHSMPRVAANGVQLNYVATGAGPETIVFAHGLLMNHRMYRAQVETLSAAYRCIAYDHRGQGDSAVTVGGYGLDDLTLDAAGLIHALDAAPCHFVGLSMGGFVGLRLAIRHPGLLRSLTLIDTSADPEPAPSRRKYAAMIVLARWLGFGLLMPAVMPIMFGATFMRDPGRAAERSYWKQQVLDADRDGALRAARAVIDREGVRPLLGRIATPTQVIVGEEDTATPLPCAMRLCDGIAGARLSIIPGAGHHSPIEQPAAVTKELTAFLSAIGSAADRDAGTSSA